MENTPDNNKIEFDGYNISLQFLRTDKSVRVIIDTSLDQYDAIKDIPKLPEGIYRIVIKPSITTPYITPYDDDNED